MAAEGRSLRRLSQNPGREPLPELDPVWLAVARRVYTNSHPDYVTEVTARLHREPESLRGVRIVRQASALRHFTARFEAALMAVDGSSYNLHRP